MFGPTQREGIRDSCKCHTQLDRYWNEPLGNSKIHISEESLLARSGRILSSIERIRRNGRQRSEKTIDIAIEEPHAK